MEKIQSKPIFSLSGIFPFVDDEEQIFELFMRSFREYKKTLPEFEFKQAEIDCTKMVREYLEYCYLVRCEAKRSQNMAAYESCVPFPKEAIKMFQPHILMGVDEHLLWEPRFCLSWMALYGDGEGVLLNFNEITRWWVKWTNFVRKMEMFTNPNFDFEKNLKALEKVKLAGLKYMNPLIGEQFED